MRRWVPTDEDGHRRWQLAVATVALVVSVVAAGGTWWSATHRGATVVENHNTIVSQTPPIQPGSDDTSKLCQPTSSGGSLASWGPDRPMFPAGQDPPYLAVNAHNDDPDHGSERNAVGILPLDEAMSERGRGWQDRLEVTRDNIYVVRMRVHFIGPENATGSGVTAMFNLPTCTGHRIGIFGIISSDDAFPYETWDGVTVWSRDDFNLVYIPDTAVYVPADGDPIPLNGEEELLTAKGALLGSNTPDGIMRAGESGYVYLKIRPQFAG